MSESYDPPGVSPAASAVPTPASERDPGPASVGPGSVVPASGGGLAGPPHAEPPSAGEPGLQEPHSAAEPPSTEPRDRGEAAARVEPLGVIVEATGNAEVDAAVERLRDADELPTDAHIEVYEDAHAGLRDALAALDEDRG